MLGVGRRSPIYLHGTCSPEGIPSTHPVRPLPDQHPQAGASIPLLPMACNELTGKPTENHGKMLAGWVLGVPE